MADEISLKNKLKLLIILGIAAGFFFLLPQNRTENKELDKNISNFKKEDDKDIISCDDNINSDLSVLLDNKKTAPDTCLFVGCSGFIY